MTDPGGLFVLIPSRVFSKEDTKSTKFGKIIFRNLRVLRGESYLLASNNSGHNFIALNTAVAAV